MIVRETPYLLWGFNSNGLSFSTFPDKTPARNEPMSQKSQGPAPLKAAREQRRGCSHAVELHPSADLRRTLSDRSKQTDTVCQVQAKAGETAGGLAARLVWLHQVSGAVSCTHGAKL